MKSKRNLAYRLKLPLLIVGTILVGSASVGWAQGPFSIIPFAESELFFEENTTDGDLGLHFKVDGDGWDRVILVNGHFESLVDVRLGGKLGSVIGLTELFSESAEPSFDEMPREDFLALFPPGPYYFFGRTLDGSWLVGFTMLTHHLPGAVELVSPEEEAEVSPDENLVIQWKTLVAPNAPNNAIEFYEIVAERDEDEGLHQVFSIIMPATATSVSVPAEFLEAGTDYKVEIIAQETSGNRSAVESPFSTEE